MHIISEFNIVEPLNVNFTVIVIFPLLSLFYAER
jgi:hypothetical protein